MPGNQLGAQQSREGREASSNPKGWRVRRKCWLGVKAEPGPRTPREQSAAAPGTHGPHDVGTPALTPPGGGIARLLEERGRRPRPVLSDGAAGASRGTSLPPGAAAPSWPCAPVKSGVWEFPHLPGPRPGLFSKTHRVHRSREGGDIAHSARAGWCPPCAGLGAGGGGLLSRHLCPGADLLSHRPSPKSAARDGHHLIVARDARGQTSRHLLSGQFFSTLG